jgi:hypothetical protein
MSWMRTPLLAVIFLGIFSQPLSAEASEFLSVQVKQGQMRSAPSFLGKVTATLVYGDKVELIEDKGAWKMVTIRKIKGWMHMSALTAKAITLQAGKANVKTGATSGELALAGKGFNAKVEAEFKSKNRHLDYATVDQMEKRFTFRPDHLQAFIKQGQIRPEGNER